MRGSVRAGTHHVVGSGRFVGGENGDQPSRWVKHDWRVLSPAAVIWWVGPGHARLRCLRASLVQVWLRIKYSLPTWTSWAGFGRAHGFAGRATANRWRSLCRDPAEIKAAVVGQDERRLVSAPSSFGHTLAAPSKQVWAMVSGCTAKVWLCRRGDGSELSRRLGMVDEAFVQRLKSLIERAGLPVRGPCAGCFGQRWPISGTDAHRQNLSW